MKRLSFRFARFFGAGALLIILLTWTSPAAVTLAADAAWSAKYWNNTTMSGNPVLERAEAAIDYDWGSGSPAAGIVNSDNFSVRWHRSVNFTAGNYRFTATTDDGMRLWLDGVLIIDSWWDSQVHSLSYDVYLNSGDHVLDVNYYEVGGQAVARVAWAAIGGTTPGNILNWRGEYFNNMTLSGTPVLVRDDPSINFDWGVSSPAWNVVAADQFSVRWTRNQTLDAGRYRFTVIVDDGARLWVNGQQLVNQWHDSIAGTYLVEIDLPGGSIPIKMEYYENQGGAVARLGWEKLSGSSAYTWHGEYYNNKTLSGTPALVREDAALNFNWGGGSPAPGTIGTDNFSVRWTRSVTFNAGRYRFSVTSDDGARLWVNGQQIINAWNDHPSLTFSGEIDLASGALPVKLEYYESGGGANVTLTWTQISTPPPPPPPTTAPTAVVQSYRLNVRTGPGTQYAILGQLDRGQTVTLSGYRSADGFWVVIPWNGGTAWISARPAYLWTSVAVSSLPVWTGSLPGNTNTNPTGTVAYCSFLNVRFGPGTGYGVVTTIPAGTVVNLLGRNEAATWAKVRLANGTIGWVNAGYLIKSVPLTNLPVVN